MPIDTSFDFRSDARGKDPDAYSPTLRQYHQSLWSKPLPSGRLFHLAATTPGAYLHHRSEMGEFILSSDSVIPSFTKWTRLKHVIDLFPPEEIEAFRSKSYTIGGMMVFPANKVDGKYTINAARGFNGKISDRFDLTLECIRRLYAGEESPIGDTLGRYGNFFSLFDGFEGYVEFFMLQDLVKVGSSGVKFFLPFDNFNGPSSPRNFDDYREYRANSIEFVDARNVRICRAVAK